MTSYAISPIESQKPKINADQRPEIWRAPDDPQHTTVLATVAASRPWRDLQAVVARSPEPVWRPGKAGRIERRRWDSNPRYSCPYTTFPTSLLRPLGHSSSSKKNVAEGGGLEPPSAFARRFSKPVPYQLDYPSGLLPFLAIIYITTRVRRFSCLGIFPSFPGQGRLVFLTCQQAANVGTVGPSYPRG